MSVVAKKDKPLHKTCELFWMKIRDELRFFVIQEKQPKKQLKLYELGEEDVCVDLNKIRQWSSDAEILVNEVMENGYADFICNKDHIRSVFKNLAFKRQHITEIDTDTTLFPNLEILNLNENLITTIQNLPASLRELHVFSNSITDISPRLRPAANLVYLGLGYNKLTDVALINIDKFFPSLIGLDVSNNFLSDIETTLANVALCKQLLMFNAYGNPIALLHSYRRNTMTALRDLKYLDNEAIVVKEESEQDAKDAANISMGVYDGIDDEQDNILLNQGDINPVRLIPLHEFKLRVALGIVENIPDGVVLDKSLYPKAEEKPEYFQTSYFCEVMLIDAFEDAARNRIDSRPRVVENWHRVYRTKVADRNRQIRKNEADYQKAVETFNQQQAALTAQASAANAKKGGKAPAAGGKGGPVAPTKPEVPAEIAQVNERLEGRAMIEDVFKDDEANTFGRLDLQIDFDEVMKVDQRSRDFFRKGVLVRLMRSEPAMKQVEEEKVVEIDEATGLPKLVETLVGVFRIDIEELLAGKEARTVQKKYVLFPENVLSLPEFYYPRNDEAKMLKAHAETVKELLEKQELAEKPVEVEVVDPKKKGADKKKDAKKAADKKPAAGKKGGKEEVTEKKTLVASQFQQDPREQVFVSKDEIILSVRKIVVAAQVEIKSS